MNDFVMLIDPCITDLFPLESTQFKDDTPVSFRSELFTSYILTIFKQ